MKLIRRPIYSERIMPYIGKNIIKVLTGQRRVGKSCILQQIADDIRQGDPRANIIYVNMEYAENHALRQPEAMTAYIEERLNAGTDNYLLIDEVQEIDSYEDVLRSVQAKGQADITVTGSNAKTLSGELVTHLSGRYIEFHVSSLSYSEFLMFHGLTDNDDNLRLYLRYGGMPYLMNLELTDDMAFEYLRNVYSTILLKDVVSREGIRNVDFLDTLVMYTADNVGCLFSANNISRYLKSQQVKMSPLIVINYLKALSNAFIINKVGRVDVAGLRKFELGDKYYFEDLGLRNCKLMSPTASDIGKLMENAVFLHLRQQGYEVFTGQTGKNEVDFVAMRNRAKVYVQVAYLIADESTWLHKFGNLMSIADNFPKYVVSLDPVIASPNVEGIHHLHIREFLKSRMAE